MSQVLTAEASLGRPDKDHHTSSQQVDALVLRLREVILNIVPLPGWLGFIFHRDASLQVFPFL